MSKGNAHLGELKSIRPSANASRQARDTGIPDPMQYRSDLHVRDEGNALPTDLKQEIQDIAQRLAVGTVVVPEAGKPQEPVLGAWQDLQAIESIRRECSALQLAEVEHVLRAAITSSAHSDADIRLLLEVVAGITRSYDCALSDFMANKVYSGLLLPNLRMVEPGEDEPNSRVFNSIVLNLAESAYDHNPLGRTLLWEGACAMFAGPRQIDRRERLRKVVFSLSNMPGEGEAKLEKPWEFMLALDELNVDEDVDPAKLQERPSSNTLVGGPADTGTSAPA